MTSPLNVFEKFVPRRYLRSIGKDGLESIMIGNAEEAAAVARALDDADIITSITTVPGADGVELAWSTL